MRNEFVLAVFIAGNLGVTFPASSEERSADELARELSNPTEAPAGMGSNLGFQARDGDLPGAEDQNSFTYLFQPTLPFPQKNGYDLLLRPAIPQAEAAAKDAEQTKKQAQQAGQGAGARGALRGAAVGALMGEIAAADAGEGAACGAAAGMIASRRRARWGQQQASQQADQQAAKTRQATAESLEEIKKAFSVCPEAKEYLVKY